MNKAEQLVIVGGGSSGCACAIEAAKLGLSVMLIDEHPQSTAAMGLDAPYFYGARLAASLSDTSAVADAVFGSNEALIDCLEAGVEVLVGTCVWGIFSPDAGDPKTRGKQLGLADEERSWIVDYDYLVLAPGARDLVLSFHNWSLPGVLGVKGASALLGRYGVLGGGRVTILGSGNAALTFAKRALEAGVDVAGVVEPTDSVIGDAALAEEIRSQGVKFYLLHTIQSALGENHVDAARLVALSEKGDVLPGETHDVPCDTICMAFATVPNIELASVAGCAIEFDADRGGWVPQLNGLMQSSVDYIYVVGEGAGVCEELIVEDAIANRQGRVAARAIAARVGLLEEATMDEVEQVPHTMGGTYPPEVWLRSLLDSAGLDVTVCQCEDVTRRELLSVAPPKYLGASDKAPQAGLGSLTECGRGSQDMLKRLTRVGMGHCQGRRCRDHSAMLIAQEAGLKLSAIVPGSYRVPVRPLTLEVLQATDETEEMRAQWPHWLHDVEDSLPEA
jgi:thioredoxin reductase